VPSPPPPALRRRTRLIHPAQVPAPPNPPSGCRFHTRCWLYERLGRPENCRTDDPELRLVGGDHRAACHYAEDALQSDVGVAHLTAERQRTRIPEVVHAPAAEPPATAADTATVTAPVPEAEAAPGSPASDGESPGG
jgi:oligopeptide/dipeptide ABC transporter ATP-binding protein